MDTQITLLIIYIIVVTVILLPLIWAGLSLAPWVPVPKDVPERVNKLANLEPGQVFYELGCGDSRVAHYIASHNPNTQVIGIEMAYPMYVWSKVKNVFLPQKNFVIKHANALKEDFSDADIVYFYMVEPTINQKLKPKLLKDLRKGAKIISYACRFLEWEGTYTTDKKGKSSKALHMYII